MRRHAVSSGLLVSLVGASLATCLLACARQAQDSGTARAQADASRPPSLDHAEQATPSAMPSTLADAAVGAKPAAATTTTAAAAKASATAAPVGDAPVHVKLVTIGMHVGGGPYDEPTKEPIKRSVEPHFGELARCWKLVSKPEQADVGVDLVIEAGGGRAHVSNPRTTVASEGFVPCVVTFFEGVEFLKPKNGKTVVSYSVRFLP
jgi:hypothetical protein